MKRKQRAEIERSCYPHGVHFKGTRQALVAAGICNPSPFPGDADDARTTDSRGVKHGHFMTTDPHGRQIKICCSGGKARGLYSVLRKELTELEAAEAERDERKREQEREQERERWKAEREENRERERMAEKRDQFKDKTAGEFKASQARIAGTLPDAVIQNMSSGAYGFRLCPEDRDRLLSLKDALIAGIMGARVIRDSEERPRLQLVKG